MLHRALGISKDSVVAFAGAGGKSSAIAAVADGLTREGMTVIVAPTTKMFLDEASGIGPIVTSEDVAGLEEEVRRALSDPGAGAIVAGSGLISKDRVAGLDPAWFPALRKLAGVTLVESDGSRRRPLKGTADHEPLLPDSATLVIAVGNITSLGKPLNDEHVHRPEVFSELTGVALDQTVTAKAFAAALARGSLRSVPEHAGRAALVTGVQPGPPMAAAAVVTRELWRLGVKKVVLSSLPAEKPGKVWMP
ncbi:MAG: selenium cofactor biosynthesis protein YqeC [Rubrobacteraceae bacterium]